MIIGIPKEIMAQEGRVGLTPAGAKVLVEAGHKVIVETRAGGASGYFDEDFMAAGAVVELNPKLIYKADLVIKVKEPQEAEHQFLKEGGAIFAFLHLPANPNLAKILQNKKIAAIAYEGVELADGQTPILQSMSKIAGEMAVKEGLRYLGKNQREVMVVVLGAGGVVGQTAVQTALNVFKTSVIALDFPEKLAWFQPDKKLINQAAAPENIEKAVAKADLLVGAIASRGAKAPKIVSRKMVASMKPGSVIVDVAIDEGGCIETSRPTTHANPVFTEEGVIHYCVKNMPGAVPKISTPALTAVTLSYILEIANKGVERAIKENPALAKGVHVYQGKILLK